MSRCKSAREHNMRLPRGGFTSPVTAVPAGTHQSVVPFAILKDADGNEIAWAFGATFDLALANGKTIAALLSRPSFTATF